MSTYNRSQQLPRLIRSLERQSVPPSAFEVIVVDDGSTDDTPAVLEDVAGRTPLRVSVIRLPRNGGQARGRNVGWRAASAPIIAFTDDDCQPQPGWLEELLKAFDDPAISIGQGRTKPDPAQWPPSSPFDHWINIDGPSAWFETCNLAYRRAVLEQVGGFDETYVKYCEDTDLGLRAVAAGSRHTYVPDAIVHHDVRPRSWREAVAATRGHVEIVRLVREHPRVREQFTHAIAYDKAQLTAVGVVSSAVVTALRPRSPFPWLALGWSVRRYLRQRPKQVAGTPIDRARLFGAWLVIDLAEAMHLLRESRRQGTFLI